jgi:hypothetical protein
LKVGVLFKKYRPAFGRLGFVIIKWVFIGNVLWAGMDAGGLEMYLFLYEPNLTLS